jgi:hypothetical protein
MKKSEKIFLGSICVISVVMLLCFGVFAGYRWYCLRKVYNNPGRFAGTSMVVKPLDLSSVSLENTTSYSFGYAFCHLPADIPFYFFKPFKSPSIAGTSAYGRIILLIPQSQSTYVFYFFQKKQCCFYFSNEHDKENI